MIAPHTLGGHNSDVLMIGTRGEELAAAHGVNTSQSPNIEMKANQVHGVSDGCDREEHSV